MLPKEISGPILALSEDCHVWPAPIHLFRVGDHVIDLKEICHIYIPKRLIWLKGSTSPFDLKSDAEMQSLLDVIECVNKSYVRIPSKAFDGS